MSTNYEPAFANCSDAQQAACVRKNRRHRLQQIMPQVVVAFTFLQIDASGVCHVMLSSISTGSHEPVMILCVAVFLVQTTWTPKVSRDLWHVELQRSQNKNFCVAERFYRLSPGELPRVTPKGTSR